MTVSKPETRAGFTFATVRGADGSFVGRVVRVEPSGTWRPDENLQGVIGSHTWASWETARDAIGGFAE